MGREFTEARNYWAPKFRKEGKTAWLQRYSSGSFYNWLKRTYGDIIEKYRGHFPFPVMAARIRIESGNGYPFIISSNRIPEVGLLQVWINYPHHYKALFGKGRRYELPLYHPIALSHPELNLWMMGIVYNFTAKTDFNKYKYWSASCVDLWIVVNIHTAIGGGALNKLIHLMNRLGYIEGKNKLTASIMQFGKDFFVLKKKDLTKIDLKEARAFIKSVEKQYSALGRRLYEFPAKMIKYCSFEDSRFKGDPIQVVRKYGHIVLPHASNQYLEYIGSVYSYSKGYPMDKTKPEAIKIPSELRLDEGISC